MTRVATTHTTFDHQSGVRERLALLAAIGPALDPSAWGYHPSRDFWYYCGGAREIQGAVQVTVKQEGSASLAIIAETWGMDRPSAMAFIGYPEVRR